jgi:hypothetical protein
MDVENAGGFCDVGQFKKREVRQVTRVFAPLMPMSFIFITAHVFVLLT